MAEDQIKRGEDLSDKGGRGNDINPDVPGQAPKPDREHLSDLTKDPNIGQGRQAEETPPTQEQKINEENLRDPITDLERKGSGAV